MISSAGGKQHKVKWQPMIGNLASKDKAWKKEELILHKEFLQSQYSR